MGFYQDLKRTTLQGIAIIGDIDAAKIEVKVKFSKIYYGFTYQW